jgi:hypothetical protein
MKDFELVVYYESMNRDLKRRPMYEFRRDERLKTKSVGSTRLTYTGLLGGLEHLNFRTPRDCNALLINFVFHTSSATRKTVSPWSWSVQVWKN